MFITESPNCCPVGMNEIMDAWALGVNHPPLVSVSVDRFHLLCEKIKASFRDERWERLAELKEELDNKLKDVFDAIGLCSSSYPQQTLFALYRRSLTQRVSC